MVGQFALMPGADLASMLEASVTEKLERLEAKRLGKVKNPRKKLEDADTSPGGRGIPAPVKRFVWARDQAQCRFESSGGRRCPERLGLQFHHDDPHGFGGDRSANNVSLLCGPHNLYMAEMDYDRDKMERYRRPDRAREPAPVYSARRNVMEAPSPKPRRNVSPVTFTLSACTPPGSSMVVSPPTTWRDQFSVSFNDSPSFS